MSAISFVEVLGYHELSQADRTQFEEFFSAATILPIEDEVLEEAVRLRQLRKMSLGDALVAATALLANRTLVTRNVSDFKWVPGLRLLDPLADSHRLEYE